MAAYSNYTDQELSNLLKEGDQLAYTEIYDRYNGLLYVFTYKRLLNREEAKDITHELFLKLWSERDRLSEVSNLPAYLYTALRNKIINFIAHQKVAGRYIDSFRGYLEQIEENNNTDYLIRHNEMQAFIEKEIASLNPRTREVFDLSRKTNLSRKEIAQQLGISEETVKSHMHGALKILKTKLGSLFFLLF